MKAVGGEGRRRLYHVRVAARREHLRQYGVERTAAPHRRRGGNLYTW